MSNLTPLQKAMENYPAYLMLDFSQEGNGTSNGQDFTYTIETKPGADQNSLSMLLSLTNYKDENGKVYTLRAAGTLNYNPSHNSDPNNLPVATGEIDGIDYVLYSMPLSPGMSRPWHTFIGIKDLAASMKTRSTLTLSLLESFDNSQNVWALLLNNSEVGNKTVVHGGLPAPK